MKTGLKLLLSLFAGMAVGVLVATILVAVFTDASLTGVVAKLCSADIAEAALSFLVGVAAFAVSLLILIPVHEAGHLVCGLLSGYKFVSFRIFNMTFIRIDGKLHVKRFSIAGTGGQCLLTPPDVPLEQVPTMWYNAGGVLANLLLLPAALPLLWLDLNAFMFEAVFVFCLADLFLIVLNGVPMKLGGIGNDAYNMLHLRNNPLGKRALVASLRSNAFIQNGVRPKDMPDELFDRTTDIDYRNPLEVSLPLMHASRLVDMMEWERAYAELEELYSHKADIIPLYVNEIACELAFCAMVTGRCEQAVSLLDTQLRNYIKQYSNVMSSKLRIQCAIALYIDNDRSKAMALYDTLKASQDKYLFQGEVRSDLAIMQWVLQKSNG